MSALNLAALMFCVASGPLGDARAEPARTQENPSGCLVVSLPSPGEREALRLMLRQARTDKELSQALKQAKRVAWLSEDLSASVDSLTSATVRQNWVVELYGHIIDKENWPRASGAFPAARAAPVDSERQASTDRIMVGPGGGFVASGPLVNTGLHLPPSVCMLLRRVSDSEFAALVETVSLPSLSTDRVKVLRASLQDRMFSFSQGKALVKCMKYREAEDEARQLLAPRTLVDADTGEKL